MHISSATSYVLLCKLLLTFDVDDVWKHHRRVLGPSMNQRYLSRMAIHVSETANLLVRLWDAKTKIAQGGAFNADIDIGLGILVSYDSN